MNNVSSTEFSGKTFLKKVFPEPLSKNFKLDIITKFAQFFCCICTNFVVLFV